MVNDFPLKPLQEPKQDLWRKNPSFISHFKEKGWSKEKIGKGMTLYRFDGEMRLEKEAGSYELSSQSIRILKVAKKTLRAQLIYTDIYLKRRGEVSDDFGLTISQLAEREPGVKALINGGYFHYAHSTNAPYKYKGSFRRGEPVGACFIQGKKISDNPKKPLWGVFSLYSSGDSLEASIEKKISPNKLLTDALGGAPLLLKGGNPLDLKEKKKRLAFLRKLIFKNRGKKKGYNPPGKFQKHMHNKEPRTAIALTEKAALFVTVDGRRREARGMRAIELALLLKKYGAIDALNLDGGGSTQMWVSGKGTVNTPADTEERPLATCIALWGD